MITGSTPDSSVNNNQNSVTRRKRGSDGSTTYIHNTVKTTEEISNNSANSIKNTVAEMEWTPYGSVNYYQNTVTRRKRITDGSTHYNNDTVTNTVMITDGSTNSNKNTATDMERIPYGSLNFTQITAAQTEMLSHGLAKQTQDEKRYGPELFTASVTTFNGDFSKEFTKIKRKIPSRIKNLERNETLDLLIGLSTQSAMDLNTSQEPSRDPCHEFGTCSVAQNKTKWYCYCDSDCQMFNDCCSDYNGTIRDSNSQLSFDCYPKTYIVGGIEGKTGFLAVNSCPDSYKNRTVKERCLQNNVTENGLFVSHGKTLTFKNKFCALCNNFTDVQEFDIVFATVESVYEYMPSLKRENRMAYFLINADYKVIPPRNTNLRFCLTNLISTSKNNQCQSHSNPILVPELLKLYKNYFCLDSNIASDMYTILCIYDRLDLNIKTEDSFSLSVLISLGNPAGGYNDENQCKEWTEEIQQQGVCSQFDVYTNICIDFIFSLFSNQVIEEESFHQIAVMVSFSYNAGNFTIRTSKIKIWIDDNGLVATVRVEMIIQKSAFRHEIEEIRKYLTKRKVRVILKNDTYNPEIEILNSNYMPNNVACITSTLSKMTIRKLKTNESSRKRKRRLTALGLTTPLFLVIPSICIDVFGPSFLSAGYGSYACFPNNYPANLIFFTGPVMVSVFVNSSCLIFVILQVCKIRTEAANIRKLNIYHEAKMYLRMVALSGIFWFIGIVNALYDSEWLEYIFTLLCGLTGFFLAVANLTTNRFKFNKRTTYSSTRETTDYEK
ncbi:unnamed protein product [Mytilus edulis]|uniref:SMB domain-containing protein n=1 Tax=Mytilus edulis TaxID=6550 RepID=A0A8S3VP09_MYTED|nr:unnamed protein product [Mytilus edulis]